eukprot:CAMPEP_0168797964 /NCGR_PEP_ID=MMETSP0725-20121227/17624_1 /TAXON_ID=265536 /ORGANISM="Amphiprora sp., Strain CCMP467" /LENGTH=455 /DNA_ID=CAMNT_0008849291 /DNA_START=60 /DNA_END=1427 /DNA_ORIENTATION=-
MPCSFGCPSQMASSSSLLMYDDRKDPPNDKPGNNGGMSSNAWTVLAKTEKWISATLSSAQGSGGQNPYSRKEVSYVCESSSESAMIVANIFRRVKEARCVGENHGQSELTRAEEGGPSYRPSTLRQTQVMVIPNNNIWNGDFFVFNSVIESINVARRHARDYVTEAHWDRMDSLEADGYDDPEWSVAVNCAHLHPEFGKKTPEQELEEMKKEEEAGEVDVNLLEYQERRLQARRSPYPSVVIEVRATPPPDFGKPAVPPPVSQTESPKSGSNDASVSQEDIMKLEQLFGKTAHLSHPTHHKTRKEEEEESAIGGTIQELSAVTPLQMAQNYIAAADPTIPPTAAFTESDSEAVDEAYEFVFTNIAMMSETVRSMKANGKEPQDVRHYVVMPRFVTSAATSLEKFSHQVLNILGAMPDLANRVKIQTYHPEHVSDTKRSPMPIIMLQWDDSSTNDE